MNGAGKNSPLDLIRQKERELAQRLREAEKSADQELGRARERAAEIQRSAESDGERVAEEFFRREMIGVEKAAAQIQAEGRMAAEGIRRLGSERMSCAVELIIDSLFPG